MVASLLVVHSLLKSHLGRAFEALRDSPIASDCMGVSVYRYKVYAFVISAGFGRAGRFSLYAYSEAIYFAEYLQLRVDHSVPAGGDHGRTQDHGSARLAGRTDRRVMLPSLLSDIDLFRKIASSLRPCWLWWVQRHLSAGAPEKRTTAGKMA